MRLPIAPISARHPACLASLDRSATVQRWQCSQTTSVRLPLSAMNASVPGGGGRFAGIVVRDLKFSMIQRCPLKSILTVQARTPAWRRVVVVAGAKRFQLRQQDADRESDFLSRPLCCIQTVRCSRRIAPRGVQQVGEHFEVRDRFLKKNAGINQHDGAPATGYSVFISSILCRTQIPEPSP
jgi:hypothetical protein